MKIISTEQESNSDKHKKVNMSQWISDGSSELTINGNIVTHQSNAIGDNVFNCMWRDGDGVLTGKHYWKIHFHSLEGGAGVGITSADHFKKGYACRGLKYLGNLSDGGRLLVSKFGPPPSAGDVIGILAVIDNQRLKVYIDVNGKSVGLAFNVPASTFKTIFPFVSFRKSGSASCTKQSEIPNIYDRALTTFAGVEGEWRLLRLQENDIQLRLQSLPTSKIRKLETNKYSWFIKVVNNISTYLSMENGNWVTSGFTSTKMIGPPELMKIERTILSLMEGLKQVKIEDNGDLFVDSDNISSIWSRYDATPQPYVGNPFA